MAIDSEARPDGIVISNADFVAHMRRVELLCNLVESMMRAMVDTPFGAMLPPDLVKQARSLGS